MRSKLSVLTGTSRQTLRAFVQVSKVVYQDDPHWVVPMASDTIHDFTDSDPYLERGQREIFVVLDGNQPVARAVASCDRLSAESLNESVGFFSHFESVRDPAVSKLLFDRLRAWFTERQVSKIMGPMSAKMTDPRGLLVEGEGRPLYGMPYTPPYYLELLEQVGLTKAMDMFELIVEIKPPYQRLARIADIARKRYPNLVVRPMNLDRMEAEIATVFAVYNQAWQKNWGFIPLDAREFLFSAGSLKSVFKPEYATLVEMDGRCIAFQMVLPDFNEVFQKMKGRMFPLGWWHLVTGIKRIHDFRALFIGVMPEFRHSGIDGLMLAHLLNDQAPRLGIKTFHVAWVLENNYWWKQEIANIAGTPDVPHKRYRVYAGAVSEG